jgi:anthranilate phosphoribosyltransferase
MDELAELGGWPAVLGPLLAGRDLTTDQARAAMAEILQGTATPAQLAGFVVALRMKGESVAELTGLLAAMLAAAELVPLDDDVRARAVDVVGTGGDRSHTINVSTLASLVVAGAGVPVCKHGNRAASSSCGSADLLEALGVNLELSPAGVAECLAIAGMAFCFAPRFHPALRHAGPSRRELGIPTAFNILGPMANPGRVRRMVVGVADPSMAERMLDVLGNHGAVQVLVVHGDDGLDELTTTTTSTMWLLEDGEVRRIPVDPGQLGLPTASVEQLRGGDPATNARLARAVLAGERGPHRDIVVLNAAAGLLVADVVPDLAAGVVVAGEVLDDGRAASALDRLVAASVAAGAADAAGAVSATVVVVPAVEPSPP